MKVVVICTQVSLIIKLFWEFGFVFATKSAITSYAEDPDAYH